MRYERNPVTHQKMRAIARKSYLLPMNLQRDLNEKDWDCKPYLAKNTHLPSVKYVVIVYDDNSVYQTNVNDPMVDIKIFGHHHPISQSFVHQDDLQKNVVKS